MGDQNRKREYRKYDDKIRVLKEAEASDETERVLKEARQVTCRSGARLVPAPRLHPSLSLPDVHRALSHHSGGGVMVRPRSPGSTSPYSRSTSSSPVRSTSPRVVTLRHRDLFRLPGGSGNTLQIPNSRQRSKSDSNVSYTEDCSMSEEVVVPVYDNIINVTTYTSPQHEPPPRLTVIRRSPSPSRRNTVAGNLHPLTDSDLETYRDQEKKLSVPIGCQLCPEIIISDHDNFNFDTVEPESDHSSQSGDLLNEVLEERSIEASLDRMIDRGFVNDFLENLHINSHQSEGQSSNLTTLTLPTGPGHLINNELVDLQPIYNSSVSSEEFVVNNPQCVEQVDTTNTGDEGLEEIMRYLNDG